MHWFRDIIDQGRLRDLLFSTPRCAHPHGLFQKIFHKHFVRRANFDLNQPAPRGIMDPIAKFGITNKEITMKFLEWITRSFQPHYCEEVYNYLSQSVDLCDLENRMKAIQRRGYL